MKTIKFLFSLMLIGGLIALQGCSKDEDPSDLEIISIEAVGTSLETGNEITVDLNGATAGSDVPLDAVITITFSKNVDTQTATATNFFIAGGPVDPTVNVTASGTDVTITPQADLERGTGYTLTLASGIKSKDGGGFSATNRTFTTAGQKIVTPPQEDHQVAYWKFDGDANATVGNFEPTFEQVTYDTDRSGFVNSAVKFSGAASAGQGDLIEYAANSAFISPSMTFSVWFKVSSDDYSGSRFMFGLAVERGYFMELGSDGVGWMKLATSHIVNPDPQGHQYGTAWTDPNGDGTTGGQVLYDYTGSISSLVANGVWHMLTMTFDANTSIKTIFIDGTKIMQVDLDLDTVEWSLKDMSVNEVGVSDLINKGLALGYAGSRDNTATGWAVYSNAENTYKGYMDDLRIFDVALTESEVNELYNAEKAK